MPLICFDCKNLIGGETWFEEPTEPCKTCIFTENSEPSNFVRKDNNEQV